MDDEIIVVALGGNAILTKNQKGTVYEEFANTRTSLNGIIKLIKAGKKIVITHGNGPQAGNMLLRVEAGIEKGIADRPLGVIVADTEGGMGYMIEQSLENLMAKNGIKNKKAITVLAQVIVNPDDPQMKNPTKPVGPFYTKEQAEDLMKDEGWKMISDAGRGFRRIVPSPIPISIVEKDVIKILVDMGIIVITVGGGGIPVYYENDGTLEGVDCVIDKDYATAVLAKEIGAPTLIISTGVDKVSLNFGKPDQKDLDILTSADCQKYLREGQFPAGSMKQKITAAINFINNGGKKVIITSPEKIWQAIEGKDGTLIIKETKKQICELIK